MRHQLHVALHGNDRNPGSAERPLRSLQAARDRLRRRPAKSSGEVIIHGGVHRLASPLELDHRDGGTADSPVVWRAAPGERVVLSGAQVVGGWKRVRVRGAPAWEVDVSGLPAFTSVWIDGERRWWPRLPMTRFADLDGQPNSGFHWNHGPQRARYAAGAIDPRWHRLEEVRLTCYQLWFETHHRIARIDRRRRLVHFRQPSLGSLIDEDSLPARFQAENVLEAFNEPGTWYRDGDRLWYRPRPDEDPSTLVAEVPVLPHLLRIQGTASRRAAHLVFSDLAFHHTAFDRDADDVGEVQAAIRLPGAIHLGWADHVSFDGCEVAHTGATGIRIDRFCHGTTVAGCRLSDLGGSGVHIHHEELKPHEPAAGDGYAAERGEPQQATICDSVIHGTGQRFPSAVGILLGNAGWCRILRNHLEDISYTAISAGWTWGYAPTRLVGTEIAGNRIVGVNVRRQLSDNGAIYLLGRAPGGIIRDNDIDGVSCHGYGGWGIYPDQGSSEWRITGNRIHGTRHAAFSTHFGRAMQFAGNLITGCGDAQVALGRWEDHRTATLAGNTIVAAQGSWSRALTAPAVQLLWRDNRLIDHRRPPIDPERLATLQRAGQHRGLSWADAGLGDGRGPCLRPAGGTADAALHAGPGARPARGWLAAVPPWRHRPVIETVIERRGPPRKDGRHWIVDWQVTWRNPGLIPAPLRPRLRAHGGRLVGALPRPCRLAPGATRTWSGSVRVPLASRLAIISSDQHDTAAVPHLAFARLVADDRRVALPLSDLPLAYGLGEDLAGSATVRREGRLLHVCWTVRDAAPRRGDKPWSASCVEIFAAAADGGATTGQLIIRPGLAGVDPDAWHLCRGRLTATPDVTLRQEAVPGGYRLEAAIPASLLGIDPNRPFRMELAASAVRSAGADAERAAWSGAPAPHVDAGGMMTIS